MRKVVFGGGNSLDNFSLVETIRLETKNFVRRTREREKLKTPDFNFLSTVSYQKNL
jgi:hypothetical protein